jgi:exonuclease III
MKVLSWNMEYWKNYFKPGWLEKCRNTLNQLINDNGIEIILLQEMNPFKLFDIEYEVKEPFQYNSVLSENELLIYHELHFELPEMVRKNPWGNVILVKKQYNYFKNILEYTSEKNYYGRNVFMCYNFDFCDIGKLILINFYNKSNSSIYTMLGEDSCFDIKPDIDEITKTDRSIIFAGDFNTGSNDSDAEHINRYSNLCNKLNGFVDISNGDPKNNQNTTYWVNPNTGSGIFLRNDFCFINNRQNIKRYSVNIPKEIEFEDSENTKRWRGISDHCPIIVEIIMNQND